ncbi:MAG: 3-phosphoglycerate dehydrogenase [Euryarchaeota archaeon]|nr:3-phosphoglycerate dehydrogenase [Euryarchaeota archaeon]MBT4802661.1 3-phosphoglycerate dehydrogenase [Euryarchaeota archaeon]
MGNILVTDGMAESAVKDLRKLGHKVTEKYFQPEELEGGILVNYDAIVVRSATKLNEKILSVSKKLSGGLGFIGRGGVGVDNIDIEAASKFDIVVCNTPQSSTQSVVEITIGHLLSSVRYISKGTSDLKNGKWTKKSLRGTELSGKNLGLIGFGRIAQGVAQIAEALGMNLHCYDPYLPKEIAKEKNCTLHDNVDDVFKNCTHISIHCNYSDETHHLVNSSRIMMMPLSGDDGVNCGRHIVNCARGGILNEDDILKSLNNGELSTVSMDVFEKEPPGLIDLINHENFQGTPHIGAATLEAQMRIGKEMVTLLDDYFNGKVPHSKLN